MSTRINSERLKYKVDGDSEKLLQLVYDKVYQEIDTIDSNITSELNYKNGKLEGNKEGMVMVLSWISALENGRSI